MEVRVVRRGGFAGIAMTATLDTSELADDDAVGAEAALAELDGDAPAPEPPHPDAFQYEIATEQEGMARSVVLNEGDVPDALRPLLDEAMKRAEVEP
jgi:hypothetical protein